MPGWVNRRRANAAWKNSLLNKRNSVRGVASKIRMFAKKFGKIFKKIWGIRQYSRRNHEWKLWA